MRHDDDEKEDCNEKKGLSVCRAGVGERVRARIWVIAETT
jgi:hypothetical protein